MLFYNLILNTELQNTLLLWAQWDIKSESSFGINNSLAFLIFFFTYVLPWGNSFHLLLKDSVYLIYS